MDHGVTVGVEIQPLLTDRGSHQDEGPEGGIERLSNMGCARYFLTLFGSLVAEAECEPGPHAMPFEVDPLT